MNTLPTWDDLLQSPAPITALAPMQDVTDLPFWRLMTRYGGPDLYYTEYFRVHATSTLERFILESITENPTGRPIVAQMIGNDIPSLVRSARQLQQYPIAAIDLNLGCPAPVVYRKCAGGGLLRFPAQVDAILGALRDAISIRFTVKTRVGFDSPALYDDLLAVFSKHSIDLLTVHGRTVHEMYRTKVHYDLIAKAASAVKCPVLANGSVDSPSKAEWVLKETGVRGLMIGRGAIRNPWLFSQIRAHLAGQAVLLPTGRDVLAYVHALYEITEPPESKETLQVQKMKKYMNYLAVGVDAEGQFLHRIRRVATRAEFFATCKEFLDHNSPMTLDPVPMPAANNEMSPANASAPVPAF